MLCLEVMIYNTYWSSNVQTVNANMDDCDGLVKDISDYMKTIVDAFQGKDIAHLDQTFDGIMDAFQQYAHVVLVIA